MRTRLLLFPALFAAGVAYGWISGYAWPAANTVALYFRRRPVTAATEADPV